MPAQLTHTLPCGSSNPVLHSRNAQRDPVDSDPEKAHNGLRYEHLHPSRPAGRRDNSPDHDRGLRSRERRATENSTADVPNWTAASNLERVAAETAAAGRPKTDPVLAEPDTSSAS